MPTATPRSYFDEALRVLAREGRNGLRIGRLCAALGVTSGSFYHHFGGWDGFVAALLEHWEREEVGRIVELVNARDDPLERVHDEAPRADRAPRGRDGDPGVGHRRRRSSRRPSARWTRGGCARSTTSSSR